MAREFAATRLRFAQSTMRPRTLAEKLGVSQRVSSSSSRGNTNPEVDTIINVVLRLGIEFVLDVAPEPQAGAGDGAGSEARRSPTTMSPSWRFVGIALPGP